VGVFFQTPSRAACMDSGESYLTEGFRTPVHSI